MRLVQMLRGAALGLALVAGVPAGSAMAQDAATVPLAGDVYDRLFAVLNDDPDQLAARALSRVTVDLMVREAPELRVIEEEQPGFLAELAKAMQPLFISFSDRVSRQHGPALVAQFRSTLSEADAAAIVEFYSSPLGQRVVRTTLRNQTVEMTSEEIWSDEAFTEADTERDMAATRDATLAALSPADVEEVERYMRQNPRVLDGIRRMRPLMITFRTAMDNEPFTPADDAALSAALEEVFARFGY